MNFVATGPLVPPFASGPWHGTQNVGKRSRPTATDASEALIGFGCLAATSRCSLGRIRSPPRGTTPAGIVNTRSPGTIRGVWVMLSLQRTTTTAPVTPPAAATIRSVRRKADAIPVSPPISVKRRTRLTGRSRSRTSSISCTGTGVYTVRSRYPFARSSSSARTVVSTWAKTPTIVSVASGMRRVPHRRRKGLLDFDDRERRHHPDEPEEQDEEPGEAADDDHRVGRARIVDAPGVGVEVVPERRDDDVEALEPHADQDENGHDVQHDRARARLPPEQDQRRDAVAEVHEPERPRVGLGHFPEERGLFDVEKASLFWK